MKSTLRMKQEAFAVALARMLVWANDQGIGLTFGDAYRDPRLHGQVGVSMGYGNKNSCHKVRLAIDLNAADPKDHDLLHDKWDLLGGSERIPADLNHYSYDWQGMR